MAGTATNVRQLNGNTRNNSWGEEGEHIMTSSQEYMLKEIYSLREELLKKNGYSNYSEYLKSEEWEKIKATIRQRKGRKWNYCNICGTDKFLDVHHSSYKVIGSSNPGNTVKILCRGCHGELHELCKTKYISFYDAFREIRGNRESTKLPIFDFKV